MKLSKEKLKDHFRTIRANISPPRADVIEKAAGFVSEDWYFLLYPDVKSTGMSARDHYIRHGYKENRSPHPLFDAEFYLKNYPDVKAAGIPAIIHYLDAGGSEWRRPCAWISIDQYFGKYAKQVAATDTHTILEDFCASDSRIEAFSYFCPSYFLQSGPRKGKTPNQLLTEYFETGFPKRLNPHPLIELDRIVGSLGPQESLVEFQRLFDFGNDLTRIPTHELTNPDFYISKYGNLPNHPIIHYLSHWKDSDLWIHPLFDSGYYKHRYNILGGEIDPLTHFVLTGEAENARPNAYFDCAFYRKTYADKLPNGQHPMNHYLDWGHLKWFQPSENFGQLYYLSRHPDVAARGEPALVYFLHEGQAAGHLPLPQKPFFDETEGLTADQMVDMIHRLAKPTEIAPEVSVVIPAYQSIEYTLRCVITMLSTGETTPFEIVINDDRSPDSSGDYLAFELADVPGIKVRINDENLGFLRSCNTSVRHCSGKYFVFLNNDTAVLPGWLDELKGTFDRTPNAGLVGSKLIYPNGLLQEAGGIIWKAGACANFGRLDDPDHPDYNYARDVDYISGAAIMIPKDLWHQLGGFSDDYAPAYYEDTDFAMKVREAGKRVIYQPLSTVVHYEGISSGTDTSTGVKRYQVVNQEKFAKRWEVTLPLYGERGDFSLEVRDRKPKAHILIVDAETPCPDKDSGSVTAFFYLKLLSELGYRVTFMPGNLAWSGRYSRDLQRLGVRVIHAPYARDAEAFIMEKGGEFDMFILSRAPVGGQLFQKVRRTFPDTPIVFDTVDLHHLRMERQAGLSGDKELAGDAWRMKQLELDVIRAADATILVSDYEVKYLRDEIGHFPSVVIPLIYEDYERKTGFGDRADIAFIGGYRHPPNIDAVKHLVEDIWPRFRAKETGARLHIIGSHMPADFQIYACEDIIVVGFVEDLESYLDSIRLTVAPLRYGAGVKGKVGNSLRMGVPVVATPIAAEGMGLVDGKHVLMAHDSASFADRMFDAYSGEPLWEALSRQGQAHVQEAFGLEAARRKLQRLAHSLTKT